MVPRNALQLAVFLRFVISRSGVRFVSPAPYKSTCYTLASPYKKTIGEPFAQYPNNPPKHYRFSRRQRAAPLMPTAAAASCRLRSRSISFLA